MNKFGVFDIDGTLIRWQLYHTIVDRLAKAGLLGPDAQHILHEARMRWKRREPGYSFRDYEIALIKTYESAIRTIDPNTFDSLLADIVAEYQDQAYTYTRDLAMTLKAQGYVLLAISGSHEELVGEVAKHYGFDDWVGTRYHRADGAFTGTKTVGSHNKQAALSKLIDKHNLSLTNSYAVGDSKSDSPMLEMVEYPIAFNPDKDLCDIAMLNGWDIVIERKNVVYSLHKNDRGQYTLQLPSII